MHAIAVMSDSREALGARIRGARGTLSQRRLGELVGVDRMTISRWENGETGAPTEKILLVAQVTGIDPTWLLTGQGSGSPRTETGPFKGVGRSAEVENSRLRWVPLHNSAPRASGAEKGEKMGFRLAELAELGFSDVDGLEATVVVGDAMQPSLRDGDIALIDTRVQEIGHDGLYALRAGGVVIVRRGEAGRTWPENPKYPPDPAGPREVIGVVVASQPDTRWRKW